MFIYRLFIINYKDKIFNLEKPFVYLPQPLYILPSSNLYISSILQLLYIFHPPNFIYLPSFILYISFILHPPTFISLPSSNLYIFSILQPLYLFHLQPLYLFHPPTFIYLPSSNLYLSAIFIVLHSNYSLTYYPKIHIKFHNYWQRMKNTSLISIFPSLLSSYASMKLSLSSARSLSET